jgi:uncharacterized protein YlxW (UPF0749 family)
VVTVLTGFAIGATADVARGTDLRSEQGLNLKELVIDRANSVEFRESRNLDLRAEVDQLILENWSSELISLRNRLSAAEITAGLRELDGAGLVVTLDDAPYDPTGNLSPDIDPNWLLIHQEDIEIVVNALLAGGAEAVSLMDQRIVSISDIKCVGSTLLINGRVYSPPFVIKAVGPVKAMQKSLKNDRGIWYLEDMAATFNLYYAVTESRSIEIPAYDNSLALKFVQPIE